MSCLMDKCVMWVNVCIIYALFNGCVLDMLCLIGECVLDMSHLMA